MIRIIHDDEIAALTLVAVEYVQLAMQATYHNLWAHQGTRE